MTTAQSPSLIAKISEWRQKARENTLTHEEMKEAIQALRRDRAGVPQATSGTRARATAKKAPINSDDLLSGLEDI
jgi:hypothetical protein